MQNNIYEKKKQINSDVGIVASRRTLNHDFEMHTHDFFEIEFITAGSAVHTINGYSYNISRGDVYLLRPSDFHSLKIKNSLSYINIMFSEQAVSTAILYELTSDRGPLYFKLDEADYKRMTSVFELITDSDTSGTLNKRYIRNLCECAMITILQKRNLIPDTKKLSKSIYRTILYINRNFRSDISIDMLACEANLSKNYFCSQFKSIFGTSTVEYINSVRLEYAKNMLVSTDIPITEICFNSGFGSYPVFSRAFKNYYGCTPSRMREGNGFSNADV